MVKDEREGDKESERMRTNLNQNLMREEELISLSLLTFDGFSSWLLHLPIEFVFGAIDFGKLT